MEVTLEFSETKSGPEVFMCASLLVSLFCTYYMYPVVCIVRFSIEFRNKVKPLIAERRC